jgi:hypothetical protein
MSVIRVDKLQSPSGTVTFTGITTFSGTGAFAISGGTSSQRPATPVTGQIRYVQGDAYINAVEYYNGSSWVQV